MNAAVVPTSINTLLALGQAKRPWDYLRAIADASEEVAVAAPVRFLLAANLGSLGFADAAIEVLNDLDRRGAAGFNTADLRRALKGKPRTRSTDLELQIWMNKDGGCLWLESGRFIGCDARREADEALESAGLLPGRVPSEHLSPLLIAGLSTPLLLARTIEATPALANGYTPQIIVVEPDAQRAERAFAMGLLEPDPERVELLIGPEAVDQLREHLVSRLGYALPRAVLRDPLVSDEVAHKIDGIRREVVLQQERETDLAQSEIQRALQGTDAAVARVRAGKSLRVLMPVSRHTSFVRHSGEDIRLALEQLGHSVRMLDEPDPHSTLSKLGYLRASIETDPDLILLINHPRWRLGDALPKGPVSVCWVQDAMPHLFTDAAAKQGKRDFLVGYRFPELIDRFGYRADRVVDAGIPVSADKFYAAPVDEHLAARFTCDVAIATRQSETPEAMIERMLAESNGDRAAGIILRFLMTRIRSAIDDDSLTLASWELDSFASEALREAGVPEPEPRRRDEILRLMVMPLADRVLRHRVLEWTASICKQHGWSLALYGKGWEHHPTLSVYARGELLHGEELRAAYQCAGVHLSASAHSLVHQRVIECALSGGRVLCYRRLMDLINLRHRMLTILAKREPDSLEDDGSALYTSSRHPEVAEYLLRLRHLERTEGQQRGEAISIKAAFREHFRAIPVPEVDQTEKQLRNTIIDHAGFTTRQDLGEALRRAIEGRDEYEVAMASIRSLGETIYGTDAVITRVLQQIGEALGDGESS